MHFSDGRLMVENRSGEKYYQEYISLYKLIILWLYCKMRNIKPLMLKVKNLYGFFILWAQL